jgi:hypothetical protein
MNFQTELVKVYCGQVDEKFSVRFLENTLLEAVRGRKVMLLYYTKLGPVEGKDITPADTTRPFYRITNTADRANLIYLSHLLCNTKDADGNYNVYNDLHDPNEPEDVDESILEMGDKTTANMVYMFKIVPLFLFPAL